VRAAIVALVAAVAVAALRAGGGGGDDVAPSWVATAKGAEVPVYPLRGAPEPDRRLAGAEHAPLVFLVKPTDGPEVAADAEWLHVYLPIRPNGSGGWIRSSDVTLRRNDHRIAIDLEDHRLTLLHRGNVQLETPIGVGTSRMPTPDGVYYVTELLVPPEDDDLYGPFAFGLSGFSDSPGAANFRGGDGTLGIHGTNDPSSIGKDISHGCIRVPNDVIRRLARTLPMGTPVEIS
jgi:lipoprotein-anchoring transpeptidase ErfK/SrfK